MPTVKDAVKAALISIEEKMGPGLSFEDFVRELDELNVSLSALDEILETQRAPGLQAQLKAIRARYEQAEELWTVCQTEIEVYEGELIPLKRVNIASLLARDVLTEFPELNQSFENGGARSADKRYASCRRLLSAIWADAMAQGKRLRTELW
jgi:hypothetical protein